MALVEIRDGVVAQAPGTRREQSLLAGPHVSVRHLIFAVLVALPTLSYAVYGGFFATPMYTSESSYVVRSPNSEAFNVLQNVLQTAGLARTKDEAFVVEAYLESRDAVAAIGEIFDLRELYGREGIDHLSAYPRLFEAPSDDALYDYFGSQLSVDYDNTTGINALSVRAFAPEEAEAINEALLTLSEDLVNRINDRARYDAVRFAQGEVERASAALEDAQAAITKFRTEALLIDPRLLSEELDTTMTGLALDLAQSRAGLRALGPDLQVSPQADEFRRRISSLEQQLLAERRTIASGPSSVAAVIADYERLFIEQQFAQERFVAALAALTQARQDAQRQKLYLERVSEPSRPDHPSHPRVVFGTLRMFIIFFSVYVIGYVVVAEVRNHEPL